MFSEPIVFEPIYQKRVWGGRALEECFGRELPENETPYGESWELVDRPEAESVVFAPAGLEGTTLGDLWRDPESRESVFGARSLSVPASRFPVLIKILDAREKLSIQVHPPASVAEELKGEPKTEMWYVADARPGASLYVGLRGGVSAEDFERGIREGKTDAQVHAIPAEAGDFIFIPSGRLHAIGAGLLIYEIQQNSDTTYRVFDWNRVGLDGNPRDLHIEESLKCIDFSDVEPGMDAADGERLVECPYFRVERWAMSSAEEREAAPEGTFAVFAVTSGEVACGGEVFGPGSFFLVPAEIEPPARFLIANAERTVVLRTTLP